MVKILRESMTRIFFKDYTIRIWREEIGESAQELEAFVGGLDRALKEDQIASLIINLPNVNAVEVLNEYGQGAVYYKDWP